MQRQSLAVLRHSIRYSRWNLHGLERLMLHFGPWSSEVPPIVPCRHFKHVRTIRRAVFSEMSFGALLTLWSYRVLA